MQSLDSFAGSGGKPSLDSFMGGGATPTPAVQPQQNTADKIWQSIAGYGKNVANTVQNAGNDVNAAFTQPGVSSAEQGINASGAAAGGVVSTAASLIPGGTTALNKVGGAISSGINAVGSALANNNGGNVNGENIGSKQGQDFAMSSAGNTANRIATVGNSLGNVANLALGGEGLATGATNTLNAGNNFLNTVKGIKYATNDIAPISTAPQTPPIDEAKITDLYNRSIKPSVAGKTNATQIADANSRAVVGLRTIADNKANLSFTNADGETLSGSTPKTVDELSQSIGQTKSTIFQQYDALAQQAGESGVMVNGSKIGSELQSVIDNKALSIANPSAVEYARSVQERFNQAGGIDAKTAQDVIQHYNDSLKAFYRNPSYDTASKAGIDALVANKLRGQLDAGISGATGEQYGALKKQYGALASIEKDVARRAQTWAKANNIGFAGNLSNIASGAELIRGLVTLNPVDLAVSGTIKAIQKYAQYLNDPDVGVSKIFQHLGGK